MREKGLRTGICPNCGSDQIYSGVEAPMKHGTHDSNAIPVTLWDSAALDNYVCVTCGFVESYVGDREILDLIPRKWPRVGQPPADAPDEGGGGA